MTHHPHETTFIMVEKQ